jgi:hypothetical protein
VGRILPDATWQKPVLAHIGEKAQDEAIEDARAPKSGPQVEEDNHGY